jgi:hypothetical protein
MKDFLLGTPPDQITESEKVRRLQDISDRMLAARNNPDPIQFFTDLQALHKEEQELDRRYPSVNPVKHED